MRTLRRKTYKVFFHPMIFGVTGSIYTHNLRTLTQNLGFGKKAEALLRTISKAASKWAVKMLISHDTMEK